MKVLVTGATGFVGRHVVGELLVQGHEVVAVARDEQRAKQMDWYNKVHFIFCDLHDPGFDPVATFGITQTMVHLAWSGLPNYNNLFHFEINLPADYRFIKKMIIAGTKQVLVAGTCLEYGMQGGPLSEDTPTFPNNPYGLAKDNLRKFLQQLQIKKPFVLQWVRLFYLHGLGQNPNSLLAKLNRSIDEGLREFNMSSGEQLRDYLPIEEAARRLVMIAERSEWSGIINCCSGQPISVRRLVEQKIIERSADIKLNLGYYPYSDYEPMAFWGSSLKFETYLATIKKESER